MTIRQFRKEIATMGKGDRIYINAINLSNRCIAELRLFISTGVLKPDLDGIKTEFTKDFISGFAILPQNDYTKTMEGLPNE